MFLPKILVVMLVCRIFRFWFLVKDDLPV